jgi:hypothetical protein
MNLLTTGVATEATEHNIASIGKALNRIDPVNVLGENAPSMVTKDGAITLDEGYMVPRGMDGVPYASADESNSIDGLSAAGVDDGTDEETDNKHVRHDNLPDNESDATVHDKAKNGKELEDNKSVEPAEGPEETAVNGGEYEDIDPESVGTIGVPEAEETAENGDAAENGDEDVDPVGTTGVLEETAKCSDEVPELMYRDDDDVDSDDDSNDEENNCEAAKSGDEIESVGTTGVPETTKNRGEIESVGTTGVPEQSIENDGTTGVPEKTIKNGGIT